MIPEDISLGSPDIQHCINFFPGASILNNATYRMRLKEHAELYQVEELVNKGLVLES